VSLVGTLSKSGGHHLHASLSDKDGKCFGGHVMEMVVFTTAEIVLGVTETKMFDRVFDKDTGFDELEVITTAKSSKKKVTCKKRVMFLSCSKLMKSFASIPKDILTNDRVIFVRTSHTHPHTNTHTQNSLSLHTHTHASKHKKKFFGCKKTWIFPTNEKERKESERQPGRYKYMASELKDLIAKKIESGTCHFLKKDSLIFELYPGSEDPQAYMRASNWLQGLGHNPLRLEKEYWMNRSSLSRVMACKVIRNIEKGYHEYDEIILLLKHSCPKTIFPILQWDSSKEREARKFLNI
jgi:predicted DNA-binding protein with PD1-like motif